jgi:hypothetical protein
LGRRESGTLRACVSPTGNMDESKSNGENQQNGRRFDPELLKKEFHCDLDQYEMLKRSSNVSSQQEEFHGK